MARFTVDVANLSKDKILEVKNIIKEEKNKLKQQSIGSIYSYQTHQNSVKEKK